MVFQSHVRTTETYQTAQLIGNIIDDQLTKALVLYVYTPYAIASHWSNFYFCYQNHT